MESELSLEQARERAAAVLGLPDDLVLLDEHLESEHYRVFFFQSRAYAETGDFEHMLVGNAPIVIPKGGGAPLRLWTGRDPQAQLDELEADWFDPARTARFDVAAWAGQLGFRTRTAENGDLLTMSDGGSTLAVVERDDGVAVERPEGGTIRTLVGAASDRDGALRILVVTVGLERRRTLHRRGLIAEPDPDVVRSCDRHGHELRWSNGWLRIARGDGTDRAVALLGAAARQPVAMLAHSVLAVTGRPLFVTPAG